LLRSFGVGGDNAVEGGGDLGKELADFLGVAFASPGEGAGFVSSDCGDMLFCLGVAQDK
jgi:hypothetical protein